MSKLKKDLKLNTSYQVYTLIKSIGEGGNGYVYEATDEEGKAVAIKFIKTEKSDTRKRLKNEIHFCESVDHPNIIKIIDRGYIELQGEVYPFYVMPLYDCSLRKKMKEGIEPATSLSIIMSILNAISFAHQSGIIHRDIKPENILLDDNMNPVICDFGIAHFSEEALITSVETRVGDRLANFVYAAPEQRTKGNVITPAADLYAVGLIINELYTGQVPQASDYAKIADLSEDYSFLDIVVDKLFKQNPGDRLQSAEDVIIEIKAAADHKKKQEIVADLDRQISADSPSYNIDLSVISKEYKDGKLVFKLNGDMPGNWFSVLTFPHFNYDYIPGYGPTELKELRSDSFYMKLSGSEDESMVVTIVKDVEEWVKQTNNSYELLVNKKIEHDRRKLEEQRKKELEVIAQEERIRDILNRA